MILSHGGYFLEHEILIGRDNEGNMDHDLVSTRLLDLDDTDLSDISDVLLQLTRKVDRELNIRAEEEEGD